MSQPVRLPVGTHSFKIKSIVIKQGKKDPESKIMHLSFEKVDDDGNADEGFKPIKEFLGVVHGSKTYMDISTSKADGLLRKLGVEEGLAKFNGDLAVLGTKNFLKDFMFETFDADVYEEKKEQTFTNEQGEDITFKARRISLED